MAWLYNHSVDVEVRINGSTSDSPLSLNVKKDGSIPSCVLTFPKGSSSRNRMLKTDKIEVFVHQDHTREYPVFTGYPRNEYGFDVATVQLFGPLSWAQKKNIVINDNRNFDNWEISHAIAEALNEVEMLDGTDKLLQATNPVCVVPAGIRKPDGVPVWSLINEFKGYAVDSFDGLNFREYTIFEFDGRIYFRKIPDISYLYGASMYLDYGQNIIEIDDADSGESPFNSLTVIGSNNIRYTYTNANRKKYDGTNEGESISDDSIRTIAEAYGTSVATVLAQIQRSKNVVIESHSIMNLIPEVSIINIDGTPFGLNQNYLLTSLEIKIDSNNFKVTGMATTKKKVLSSSISRALGIGTGSIKVSPIA